MEKISLQSEKEPFFQREFPFKQREFKPYFNGKWIGNAVSYGCYREGQAPGVKGPTEAQILEDLQIIERHWNMIRVYGSDEDSEKILKVIRKHNLPIRVMLGVWIENEVTTPGRKELNENPLHRWRCGGSLDRDSRLWRQTALRGCLADVSPPHPNKK